MCCVYYLYQYLLSRSSSFIIMYNFVVKIPSASHNIEFMFPNHITCITIDHMITGMHSFLFAGAISSSLYIPVGYSSVGRVLISSNDVSYQCIITSYLHNIGWW